MRFEVHFEHWQMSEAFQSLLQYRYSLPSAPLLLCVKFLDGQAPSFCGGMEVRLRRGCFMGDRNVRPPGGAVLRFSWEVRMDETAAIWLGH